MEFVTKLRLRVGYDLICQAPIANAQCPMLMPLLETCFFPI